jgi:hypothetical protein
LTSRRFKRIHTKPEIQHQSKPSEPQQNSTATQHVQKSTNISNADRDILAIKNRQYIDAQAAAHETQLANEIRQIYCKITTIQRNQALLLAQSNGLLAAQALNLKKCSRVSGSGSTLTLHNSAHTINRKINSLWLPALFSRSLFKFHYRERRLVSPPLSRKFLVHRICVLELLDV